METEERPATTAEQEVLAQWSSWGALPEVFEGHREDWADLQASVRGTLTSQEFNAALSTTMNAHYTDPVIVAQVWGALEGAGFGGGPVLEPGCGAGTFIGLAPTSAQMVGVELDPMTARIAAALYPGAQIRAEGFETSRLEGPFNAVVGNVPFGGFALYDPLDNPRGLSIHNHFIVKSLKATAPGGYVAVLTSSFTMDAKRSTARSEMGRYGDLLGAVRLPTGAFARVARTDVVTDILVFRRRDPAHVVDLGTLPWVDTTDVEAEPGRGAPDHGPHVATVNQYWTTNPAHILGELRVGQGMYGATTLEVAPNPEGDLPGQVRIALGQVMNTGHAQGLTYAPQTDRPAPGELTASGLRFPVPAAEQVQAGHVRETAKSGFFQSWNGTMWEQVSVPANQVAQTRLLLGLRDAATAVIDSQRNDTTTQDRHEARGWLHSAYDTYTGVHGPVNRFEWSTPRAIAQARITKDREARTRAWRTALPAGVDAVARAEAEPSQDLVTEWEQELAEGAKRNKLQPHLRALRTDPQFALVLALEHFDENTGQARKAQIFDGDVVGRSAPRTTAETAADALAISLDETRTVNLDRIAALLSLDTDQVRDDLGTLVFDDPATGRLEPAARYLSGNVRAKHAAALSAAQTNPAFEVNAAALDEVVPATIGIEDIVIRPGVRYVSAGDYASFISEAFKLDAEIGYNTFESKWDLDGPRRATYAADVMYNFGTDRRTPLELLESVMNNAPVTITKVIIVGEAERTVRDVQATTLAREKCEAIQRAFSAWTVAEPDRAKRIATEYNTRFNSHVSPDYTAQGNALALEGMSPNFTPHPYQREATARIVNEPSVLLDHVVGAGKTGTMIMGAMELRRTAIARKPWLVVPNHLVEQIAAEWTQWYPGANVMAIPTGCTAAERRGWIARSAASDWDGVVVPASVFKLINVDPARSAQWLAQDLDALRGDLADASDSRKGPDSPRAKKIAKQITTLEERHAKAFSSKDAGLTFESSGCDYLFVDEAHHYKNLPRISAHPELAHTGSGQAMDLDHKLRALREAKYEQAEREGTLVPGYLPAVATFATGTPVANSLSEMWVMQHYLRPDMLEAAGVHTVDAWAGQFTQNLTKLEIGPDGSTWRMRDRIAAFQNAPELLAMTQQFASVVTRADITAALPTLEGGTRHLVSRPASAQVTDYVTDLAMRANNLPSDPSIDNLLKITNDGRMVALDPRMKGQPKDPDGGRIGDVATNIMRIDAQFATTTYTDAFGDPSPRPGGLQLVFADRGIPNPDRRFSVYEALRQELTGRGMDSSRVRFIHEATDDASRGELFQACRDGRVSVLIGSTDKMGTGVNVQARATALHHMDCPYRPADLEQREGRSLRQGNQNAHTTVFQYVTEGTYDAVMWQIVARKAAFIAQVKTKRITGRIIEDLSDDMTISAAAASAVATGDPRIIERAETIAQIATLESLEQGFGSERGALLREDRAAAAEVTRLTTHLPRLEELTGAYQDTSGDNFTMHVAGQHHSKRTVAAGALLPVLREALAQMDANIDVEVDVAIVGNTRLRARATQRDRGMVVFIPGSTGTGTVLLDKDLTGDGLGVVRRLEHLAGSSSLELGEATRRITALTTRRSELVGVTAGQFTRAPELAELRQRLAALDEELEMATDLPEDEPAEPERLDGPELARAFGTHVDARHLADHDIITGLPKAGMWQVLPSGDENDWQRTIQKVGSAEGTGHMVISRNKEFELVSRLRSNIGALHQQLLADPTATYASHPFRVNSGDDVTVYGVPIITTPAGREPGKEPILARGIAGKHFTARHGDAREVREAWNITDPQGRTTMVIPQRQGEALAITHGVLRPAADPSASVPLTLGRLAPGDVLTGPTQETEGVDSLPAGTLVAQTPGFKGMVVFLDPAGTLTPRLHHHNDLEVQASTTRPVTTQEARTLWPNLDFEAGIPVSELRPGDVVASDDLDPKSPRRQDVVITRVGYGTMRDLGYRPTDNKAQKTTNARRKQDQRVRVSARPFGALHDSEVRVLGTSQARFVDPRTLTEGTEGVVMYGTVTRGPGTSDEPIIGTYAGRTGKDWNTQHELHTPEGVVVLSRADNHAVLYSGGAQVPATVDRTGAQTPNPAPQPAAPARAVVPQRVSIGGAQGHVYPAARGVSMIEF